MKYTFSFLTAFWLAAAPVCAQYVEQKETDKASNRPLSEFAMQQKVLWNFDWEFSIGKE